MTGARFARTAAHGQHVQDHDGYVWIKLDDNEWEDGSGGSSRGDRDIDEMIARRKAEPVSLRVDLDTEDVPAYEVNAGEYVIVPWGFWNSTFIDDDPTQSHELWRVAHWTWHGPVTSTLLFDAPEPRLARSNFFLSLADFGHDDANWDRRAIEMYVDATTVLRVVLPGQDHENWDGEWDWSDEFKIVGTRQQEGY